MPLDLNAVVPVVPTGGCAALLQGQDTAGRHHVPLDHSELTALSAATDRLFQDTAGMEDEAVVTLLGALHLVSAASLPSAGQQPGHTK